MAEKGEIGDCEIAGFRDPSGVEGGKDRTNRANGPYKEVCDLRGGAGEVTTVDDGRWLR